MSFGEEARRRQLVEMTVAQVAAHGYTRCTLARIAEAAGVTKPAVLYHFGSRSALIRAAYEQVRDALVARVGEAVDAAPTPFAALEAYVTTMIGHLAAHPDHVRVLAEALAEPDVTDDRDDRAARWGPLAALITAAHGPDVDARVRAVVVGGAIDGVVAERLDDPSFPLEAAVATVLALVRPAATPPG